jgi:uncharacterized protein
MEQRLSLITLGVADVARARAFYERLGWHASSASVAEIAFFQVGSCVLGLYSQAQLSLDSALAETPPAPGGITLAYNTRAKEEVDVLLEEALRAGACLLAAPREMPWGGYTAYFADLDGHPWEISWVPQFPVLEDGSLRVPD